MKTKLKPCSDCKALTVIWKNYGKLKCCKTCSIKRDGVKPIPKESAKRKKENREYAKEKIPEGQICEFPGCDKPGDTKHHPAGRQNKRLHDKVKYLCRPHHRLITDNSKLGIELGLSERRTKKIGECNDKSTEIKQA